MPTGCLVKSTSNRCPVNTHNIVDGWCETVAVNTCRIFRSHIKKHNFKNSYNVKSEKAFRWIDSKKLNCFCYVSFKIRDIQVIGAAASKLGTGGFTVHAMSVTYNDVHRKSYFRIKRKDLQRVFGISIEIIVNLKLQHEYENMTKTE
uniref:LAGLIDADG homing endonuclease n=1 Tax=Romanomermis culicivorax TaxID=13658 RepID=A0A915JD52_ROMCU